mmetsp:Transcript_108552/g.306968  ORF Transcript_108552/g.306968 Transcript_108552/m.306968 type:complete len:232 (-) Transcript_108552:315-1010(-)
MHQEPCKSCLGRSPGSAERLRSRIDVWSRWAFQGAALHRLTVAPESIRAATAPLLQLDRRRPAPHGDGWSCPWRPAARSKPGARSIFCGPPPASRPSVARTSANAPHQHSRLRLLQASAPRPISQSSCKMISVAVIVKASAALVLSGLPRGTGLLCGGARPPATVGGVPSNRPGRAAPAETSPPSTAARTGEATRVRGSISELSAGVAFAPAAIISQFGSHRLAAGPQFAG